MKLRSYFVMTISGLHIFELEIYDQYMCCVLRSVVLVKGYKYLCDRYKYSCDIKKVMINTSTYMRY